MGKYSFCFRLRTHALLLLVAMTWVSCENPITVVREIAREDTLAAVTATDITYTRSDSGEVFMILNAPLMLQYGGDDQMIEFPNGFEAFFLDSIKQPTSRIKGNYGVSYEKVKLMIARGDVEVENYQTNELLNTETLYWNQQSRKIFTSAAVKISGPEKLIYGDSLVAAEDFSSRTIFNIRATLEIEEED